LDEEVQDARVKRASRVMFSFAIVLQACGPNPNASPSGIVAPSSTPSSASAEPASAPAEPTPNAQTTAPARITWESVGPPEPGAEVRAGIWDKEVGWIVTGAHNCPDLSDCWHDPAIWTSADGRAWTRAQVPQQRFSVVTAITRGADAYFAAGYQCEGRTTALIWRSVDARRWERHGSFDLGSTDDGECNTVNNLAATDAGLFATVGFDVIDRRYVYRSPDGVDWTPVNPERFGLPADEALYVTATVQVDRSTAILVGACSDCPVAAWQSGDGADWTDLGRLDAQGFVRALASAAGPRLVVATSALNPYAEPGQCPECRVSVWALEDDGTFREGGDTALVYDPELAVVGNTYLLVGTGQLPGEYGAFASADGLAWTGISIDSQLCGASELVGGPTQALILTNAYDNSGKTTDACGGMWLGEVTAG